MSSFGDEVRRALNTYIKYYVHLPAEVDKEATTAAITAAHDRAMEQFVEAAKQGISTESCYKHSPDDGNPMLHHQQVYDELDWQRARIKGEA